MNKKVIELQNVSKIYSLGSTKVNALKNVNLAINSGEFVTIMGPSGSGKSTLLNMIGCLDIPSEGCVKINNIDTSSINDYELTIIRRDNIGFVFQQFNLIHSLTAKENVELSLIFKNIPLKEREAKVLYLFKNIRLDLNYMNHKPGELSGGQQQRIAIARALANDPPIILADEPTGNLDSNTGQSIMNLLKELNLKGITIIVVTHDLRLKRYANRFVEINDGEIANEYNKL